jgi:pimeloyl-ACP methyl ester carboxylesterase
VPTQHVKVNESELHYLYADSTDADSTALHGIDPDFSARKTIIFVHGGGSNADSFRHQVEGLGSKYVPIALDLPGHGRSAGADALTCIADYAEVVAAFMDAASVECAVIAGRSMGSLIAIDFALRFPERLKALVLISAAAKFNISSERLAWYKTRAERLAPRKSPLVTYLDVLAVTKADLRERVSEIRKPTLIIVGASDVAVRGDARFLSEQIMGAVLVVIPDAGHAVTSEKPVEVNSAIDSFLTSLG